MPIASGAVVVCPLDHVLLQSFGRSSRGCGRLFLRGTSEGYCSSHFLPSPFEYEQRMAGITAVRHHLPSGLKLSVRFFWSSRPVTARIGHQPCGRVHPKNPFFSSQRSYFSAFSLLPWGRSTSKTQYPCGFQPHGLMLLMGGMGDAGLL